jgi:UDP-N-acetylmuramate dehydrogenase
MTTPMQLLNIKKNINLAPHTTFRIGGPAKFFVEVKNSDELIKAVSWAKKEKVKYFILGGGSNILFDDKGYKGLIIKITSKKIELIKNKNLIIASAGANLSQLVKFSLENNLKGLEWASGIYGTVGGAVFGNAGANKGCMADVVEEVEVCNGKKIEVLNNKDLNFKYRSSAIKKGETIISVKLKLKKGDKKESEELSKKYLKQRKEKQPKGFCAGSIFKNPKANVSAGFLIEQCGLKGLKIGKAKISEKHGNFIINLGNAKSSDVLALIEKAKNEVEKKFAIKLKEELTIV